MSVFIFLHCLKWRFDDLLVGNIKPFYRHIDSVLVRLVQEVNLHYRSCVVYVQYRCISFSLQWKLIDIITQER